MEIGLLILRLVVGLTVAAHGVQKLFGWFGGTDLAGVGGFFETLGFRPGKLHAFLAGASEAGGRLLLALGFLTPLGAAAVIAVMLVAAVSVHSKSFFVPKGGFEYTLALGAPALTLAFTGPGSISLDAVLGLRLAGPGWGAGAFLVGIAGGLATLASRRPAAQQTHPATR